MDFTHRLALLLLLGVTFIYTVNGKFPHCQFQWEMQRARRECETLLQHAHTQTHTGCLGEWDNVSCWQRAAVGEVMTLPCPAPIFSLFGKDGNLSRTCTETGWSDVSPPLSIACWSNNTDEPGELVFYRVVKIFSTLGHSLSFITLLTSTIIICLYRKLHCTRNYVHLNLFLSFMLRAAAVLSKDALLFSEEQNAECSAQPSLVGCKAVLVVFNYFVMANFFWLLVEGLYLHTLLLVLRSCSTRLPVYLLIGWGIPLVFMVAWIVCRINLEDTQCWEMNENPIANRLMNWPIMASVIINFVLFVSIIRILLQKLRCPNVGGNEQSQYRRLAKSTLLLIPLFGINYVVFVYLIEPADTNLRDVKIFFELALGSFQGLIVAVLYCFLNSEVQMELRRTWRSLSLRRYAGQDYRTHAMSVSRNGNDSSAHFARSSRAQSIPQTETTVL
ncbi:vasoactive intestinal polypeptide receptor 2-like isoform X2 [Pungitius pungitius]|uniref:vasoactive intestinal polypeptide receptor 2-like isoform X2 n=1 Tax=Pungitius pungitius TaxID=134920 RepID=UPI002E120746